MNLRSKIDRDKVPKGSIALWWLGQSGYICKSPARTLLAIDPYLSNACKAVGERAGMRLDRMVAAPMPAGDLAVSTLM